MLVRLKVKEYSTVILFGWLYSLWRPLECSDTVQMFKCQAYKRPCDSHYSFIFCSLTKHYWKTLKVKLKHK